jgi:hypothetical protein
MSAGEPVAPRSIHQDRSDSNAPAKAYARAWRRLGSDDGLPVAGVVLYAFAMVAVMNAAVYGGLVTASVAPHIAAAAPAASEAWQVAFRYNGQVNQAFARVFVVASGAAIVLWSVAIIRRERWPGHWDGTDACSGPSRWPPCSPGT